MANAIDGFSKTIKGRRADLDNRYFRSRWEANYARYLRFLVEQKKLLSWEYECRTFWFEAIKRGTRSYMPDFKVTLPDGKIEWHEVKGYMDAKSKTRLKRMAKYYPDEKILIIDKKWFASNKTVAHVIPGWEK